MQLQIWSQHKLFHDHTGHPVDALPAETCPTSARYAQQLTVSPDARHDISSFHAKRFPPVRPQFVTFFVGNAFLGKRHRERDLGMGAPVGSAGGREGRGRERGACGRHAFFSSSPRSSLPPPRPREKWSVPGNAARETNNLSSILYLVIDRAAAAAAAAELAS